MIFLSLCTYSDIRAVQKQMQSHLPGLQIQCVEFTSRPSIKFFLDGAYKSDGDRHGALSLEFFSLNFTIADIPEFTC